MTNFCYTPPFPKNMLMESTNLCNHQCVFCANKKMKRAALFMDPTFAESVLEQAARLGTEQVGFYTVGEPLLNKNLHLMVRSAKKLGYQYIYCDTNGALAQLDRLVPLIEEGLDSIKFSINAGTRANYQKIHGRDDFDAVIKNLKELSAYRETSGRRFKILISFIKTKLTSDEVDGFVDTYGPLVDDIIIHPVSLQGGSMTELLDSDLMLPERMKPERPCPMVFERLHVTAEGYLTACCTDFDNDLAVADLNKMSLEEAWNSPVYQSLRRAHLENTLKGTLCYNCIYEADEPYSPLMKTV